MYKLRLTALVIVAIYTSLSISHAGVNEVRLTGVTGTHQDWTGVKLAGGGSHELKITFDATGGVGYTWVGMNAFEMYSPDGANWLSLRASRENYIWDLPLRYSIESGLCGPAESFLRHFNKTGGSGTFVVTADGPNLTECFCIVQPCYVPDPYTTVAAGGNVNGNDTVAFYHALSSTQEVGYLGGTSGAALTVEFYSQAQDGGKHICFDTTEQLVSWEWSAPGYPVNGGNDNPTWDNGTGTDGPICWEIWEPCILPPFWCDMTTGNISAGYCHELTYQLCGMTCMGPPTYEILPPYNNGEYGSVNAQTGLWTWSRGTVQPGAYQIQFRLNDGVDYAPEPFTLNVLVTTNGCDCCAGKVGDANGSGDDLPTIGDINAMIDHLFISEQPLACYPEADANGSGGVYPHASDITIGDINLLIDYLFITGPEAFGPLPDCPVME
jgi:hypothetical protein